MVEGTPAPDVDLRDDEGRTVRLSDFRGKPLVLYFYSRDDTPGCTKEACEFRDAYAEFRKRGLEVLGVSPDDEASHARFKAKHGLPFRLLADPDHRLAEALGVWSEKSMYGRKFMGIKRSTFVISPDGTIVKAWRSVRPAGHAAKVLEEVESSG